MVWVVLVVGEVALDAQQHFGIWVFFVDEVAIDLLGLVEPVFGFLSVYGGKR